MQLTVEPKDIAEAYSTPIVQQTSFWSGVKAHLGMRSKAFEFSIRNSDREYQKFCVRGDFQRVATSHSFVFRTCVFSVSSVKGNALVRSPRRIISAAPSHAMARGCRSGERLISVPL